MAEFLGIIGGVAASSDIANSLIALKRLCSTVREADQTVNFLLDEVQNVNTILQSVEVLQSQLLPYVRYDSGWIDCQKPCQAVAIELSKIILDLKHRIEKHRWLGSLRYALKEDKILEMHARLERAKSNVLLAQQTLRGALQHQQFLQTVDLRSMILGIQGQLQHALVVPMDQPVEFNQSEASVARSSNKQRSMFRSSKMEETDTQIMTLTTQLWLFNMGLQLYARLCKGNWTFNFRTYYSVPADAMISQLCAAGDIRGIKELLSTKNALMSARIQPWGMTPLHVAISQGQVETARFLIQHGADPDDRTLRPCHGYKGKYAGVPWSCFQVFSYYCDSEPENPTWQAKRSDMLYLLAQENYCDDLSGEHAAPSIDQWLDWTACIAEEEDIEILKKSVFPPYETIPLQQRLRWACASAKILPSKFWRVLGQHTFDDDCVALALKDRSCNPLPRLMDYFAQSIRIRRQVGGIRLMWRVSSRTGEWKKNLSKFIRGRGFDLLLRGRICYGDEQFPLRGRLGGCLKCFLNGLRPWSGCSMAALAEGLDQATKLFAQLLVEAGASGHQLESLGRRLRPECVGNTVLWSSNHRWRSRFWLETLSIRILNFTYGPEPSDWRIWIAVPLDETAGDFWRLVESSQTANAGSSDHDYANIQVPGAWPTDEESKFSLSERSHLYFKQCLCDFSLSRRRRRRLLRYLGVPKTREAEVFRPDAFRRAGWAPKMTWQNNIEARKFFYGVSSRKSVDTTLQVGDEALDTSAY